MSEEKPRKVRIVNSIDPSENGKTGILLSRIGDDEYRIGVLGHVRSYERADFEELPEEEANDEQA